MNSEQYNSPETVGWLALIVVIILLSVLTFSLIRDKVRAHRQHQAELEALRNCKRKQRKLDIAHFQTVQEAQDDFR